MHLNTIAHLVARALRDRRTVTWSHFNSGTGYWRFHGKTRSQILHDVRRTPDNLFTYGLEYDPSRPPRTNGRYGLQAYAITPETPAPAPRDYAAELTALRIERITTDFAELTPEARAKVLQTLTLSANQTAKNALR